MLSFNSGERKLAIVQGGKLHNKILKLKTTEEDSSDSNSDSDDDIEPEYPLDYLDDEFIEKKLNMRLTRDVKYNKIELLKRALDSKNKKKLPKELLPIYNDAMKKIKNNTKKEFVLDDGKLIPLPQPLESGSERGYVAGPSGSGKSTYVGNYIKMYKKLYPKRKIYIFSRLESDPLLDVYKPNRILLDESIIEEPIEPGDLSEGVGCLCIFDDIDTIKDAKICKAVFKLRDDICQVGRHDNITCICTGHQLCDYKKTRDLLNESSFVTFFPGSGSKYHIQRFLKIYCGLDNDNIKKVLSLPSRWVTIYKVYPQLIIYSTGCFLIG